MPTKETSSENNVWFGVAMFLIGLIAGVILAFASGSLPLAIREGTPSTAGAPQAPQAPQAPKRTADVRMASYASALGINAAQFKACIAANTYTTVRPFACTSGPACDIINDQQARGKAAGISGTPGNIVYDLTSKKGILLSGAQPLTNFQSVVDGMLKDPSNALAQPGVQLAGDVAPIDFEQDNIRGAETAKIALIEYSDYECPYCHAVHPTYEALMKKYDGKVMWVLRHFPLDFHAEALPLAIGAECVRDLAGSDAFWKFSDSVLKE